MRDRYIYCINCLRYLEKSRLLIDQLQTGVLIEYVPQRERESEYYFTLVKQLDTLQRQYDKVIKYLGLMSKSIEAP